MDMFAGLGSETPGKMTRPDYLDGLGLYTVELTSVRYFTSTNKATEGHAMVAMECVIKEVHRSYDEAEADAVVAAIEDPELREEAERGLAKGPHKPTHEPGQWVGTVWNITKNRYALKDVRGIIDGLVPYLPGILTEDEVEAFREVAAEGKDQFAWLANVLFAGNGTRVDGREILALVSAEAGKPFAKRMFGALGTYEVRADQVALVTPPRGKK